MKASCPMVEFLSVYIVKIQFQLKGCRLGEHGWAGGKCVY